jgi:hypothetical protein
VDRIEVGQVTGKRDLAVDYRARLMESIGKRSPQGSALVAYGGVLSDSERPGEKLPAPARFLLCASVSAVILAAWQFPRTTSSAHGRASSSSRGAPYHE